MQNSPFCNTKRRPVSLHGNSSNGAATEWFHRKFGPAIQLSERRKNECKRKQKKQNYYEVKKNLEKCLAVRRHENLERRYSFYNAENELFEDEGEEEKEEEEGESGEEGNDEEEKERNNLEREKESEEEEKGGEEIEDEEELEDESGEDDEEEEERSKLEGEKENEEEEMEEKKGGEQIENEGNEAFVEEEEEEETEDEKRVEDDEEEKEETPNEAEEWEKEEEEEEEGTKDGKEEDDEEVEEKEKETDYESGEEGIELKRKKVVTEERDEPQLDDAAVKRKLVDLFDDEASLSGDDVGSDLDQESRDGLDEYEAEEGDLDQLPDTEEIRENLVRQFLKHQNDDSDRQLLRLQEAFFADSDLHGQGGTGDRSFRFRMHADANVDWTKLLGTMDDDNEDDEIGQEQRQWEEEWHQKRLQMIKWKTEEQEQKRRAMKRTREDDDEEEEEGTNGDRRERSGDNEIGAIADPVELDSPLFTLGKKLLRTGKAANANVAHSAFCPGPSSSSSSLILASSSSFADVFIPPPPPKRRDSLLSIYHRNAIAAAVASERTVSSPSVELSQGQQNR